MKKITMIDRLSMVLLLLAPILSIYGKPDGWNLEVATSLPMSLFVFTYYFLSNDKRFLLPQGLIWYFVYWSALFMMTTMQFPLFMIQVFLFSFMAFATFHREQYIKMYQIFALVCIILFFLQEASFYLTGNRISGVLSFLPKSGNLTMSEYMSVQEEASRSSSFFAEPAHFAQFLLPLFAIELYFDKSKIRSIFIIAIAAALLLLRSGNSLLGVAAVLVFLLPYYYKKKSKYRWFSLLFVSFFIALVGYEYVNSEMGSNLLERQGELSMVYEGGSRSGFLRIWRGYYVYADYSIMEKIFGCADNNVLLGHVFSSGMIMNVGQELYFNGFQKILLNTGLVGVVIFCFVYYKIWINNTVCGKAILLTLIVLSFIAAIYMTHTMILYMVLAEGMKCKKSSPSALLEKH